MIYATQETGLSLAFPAALFTPKDAKWHICPARDVKEMSRWFLMLRQWEEYGKDLYQEIFHFWL